MTDPGSAFLIERGAPIDARGDSYSSERRAPDSVRALLDAGASLDGVRYAEVDELMRARGAVA